MYELKNTICLICLVIFEYLALKLVPMWLFINYNVKENVDSLYYKIIIWYQIRLNYCRRTLIFQKKAYAL